MKKKKEDYNYTKKLINKIAYKFLLSILLFLLFLICNKKIEGFNSFIYDKIYSSNISFAKINNWYESHFGSIFPVKSITEVQVFDEALSYKSKESFLDGVKLTVNDNYIVPSINDGIIIFLGEKENYGKTIIIEDELGVDTWYCNINIGNINIYDYVNKGDYLGEVIDNKLIMVFQKEGKIEDYNKYI